ncbi:nuclear transcription factor Y subunit beta-like [Cloeon dipterum]|uniref:nuclear transcription factor Y subunit beta-like n=1 Tax=Cloeon dipterum TaxID=197152 RepID=UPI0032208EA4
MHYLLFLQIFQNFGPTQQQIRPLLQQSQPNIVEARQQNLRKIQQLRHTLEQAQQQEQQYSRQMMEVIGFHGDSLNLQEEQQNQLRAQLQRQMNMAQPMQPQGMAPQQRMIRPSGPAMTSNPGLRHLLQQQPQYRQQQQQQQVIGMNQMGGPRAYQA